MEKVRVKEPEDLNLRVGALQNGFDQITDAITGVENRLESLENKMDEVLDILKNGYPRKQQD